MYWGILAGTLQNVLVLLPWFKKKKKGQSIQRPVHSDRCIKRGSDLSVTIRGSVCGLLGLVSRWAPPGDVHSKAQGKGVCLRISAYISWPASFIYLFSQEFCFSDPYPSNSPIPTDRFNSRDP